MIPLPSAISHVSRITDEALRDKVVSSVLTGDLVGSRTYNEEEPEDVFIPLLLPGSPRRAAVVAGCRDLCGQVLTLINDPQKVLENTTAVIVAHFVALLGASQPLELRQQIRSLLEMALDSSVPANVRDPIVSLAVDFATDESDAAYWQKHFEADIIPGQAFQALLKIDPLNPRVERALVDLWIRALRNQMSLKVPFAAQRWASFQPSADTAIRRVIETIMQIEPDIRKELEADCARYRHSKAWVKFIPAKFHRVPLVRFEAKSEKTDVREKIVTIDTGVFTNEPGGEWIKNIFDAERINVGELIFSQIEKTPLHESPFLSTGPTARLTKIRFGKGPHAQTFHRLVLSHEEADQEYELWIDTALQTLTTNLVGQLTGSTSHQGILKKHGR